MHKEYLLRKGKWSIYSKYQVVIIRQKTKQRGGLVQLDLKSRTFDEEVQIFKIHFFFTCSACTAELKGRAPHKSSKMAFATLFVVTVALMQLMMHHSTLSRAQIQSLASFLCKASLWLDHSTTSRAQTLSSISQF